MVIQDPVWEQSYPDIGGLVVAFEPPDGTPAAVSSGSARPRPTGAGRTTRNDARDLLHRLRALDLEPVLVSSHEHRDVLYSFLTWADQRLFTRRA